MSRKVSFHPSDFVLILLAILAAAGLLWRFGVLRTGQNRELRTCTVTAVCYDLDARTAGCLSVGDELYTDAGEAFGTVTLLSGTPHEEILRGAGGERIAVRLPEGTREDVYLSVSLRGTASDGILLRENGRAVLGGETYRLYTRYAAVDLYILSVLTS